MVHTPAWDAALEQGWQVAAATIHSVPNATFSRVLVVGMGGSGIAGSLVALISKRFSGAPVAVLDTPEVPATLSSDTLCIVCSYSGNTWETLAAYEQLVAMGAAVVVIASGGQLAARAVTHAVPFIAIPTGHVPRAVLPWFLASICALLDHYGLVPHMRDLIEKTAGHWRMHGAHVHQQETVAQACDVLRDAAFCHVWGVRGDTGAAAYRAQTQLNENSKMGAVFSCFPELNHNLLVGFTPAGQYPPILFLQTDFCSPLLQCAAQSLQEVLGSRRIPLYKPVLLGDTWWEQVAYSLWWSDSVSYHVGCERGHAIEATVLIDQLKQTFSRKAVNHEEKPSS